MWGRWSHDGIEAWREFGSLGDERVHVEFDEVQSIVGEDVAVAHAFVTFTGLSAEGEALRSLNNRLTWILRRTADGSWKVVHEHTSGSADFETGKVILER